ncbi:MAG: flagellar hook-basal body protein [Oscillospiraceae bacterium]|nr:flagellar hook-basal body protein [Oscillospiraceae bacterium]
MVRGLYTAGWAMLVLNKKMDAIANNIANADTAGFKRDVTGLQSFPEIMHVKVHDQQYRSHQQRIGNVNPSSEISVYQTDYQQGAIFQTWNALDMAIGDSGAVGPEGERAAAFFVIGVPQGDGADDLRPLYTRDGGFKLGADGYVATTEGHRLLGENGPIALAHDEFLLTPDGTVIQDGAIVDRVLIVEFTNPSTLRKVGDNLFDITEGTNAAAFTGRVDQGYIERSNVTVVREMVDLITVTRAYEANQKVIQVADETLSKAMGEMGIVR